MYDLILRGGTVVDGTRSRPYAADVCIRDGRIARIAPDEGEEAREVVDVSGLTVAPGFIDIHSHSDACPLLSFQPESKLFQGITTEITGNCGTSILPSLPENSREIVQYFFDDTSMFSQVVLNEKDRSLDGLYGVEEYARAVAAHGCTANYGQLVGHGTLRGAVMGFVDRDPGPEEMERLKDLLERELRAGAFGMSLGLIYPPSAFCKREELVELAKVLKKYDALLTVHMRNEGPRIFQAVDEMLDITRRSGVHLQISHLKLMGRPQWGRSRELLDKLAAARREGLNVTCDQYPYTATSTSMTALVPKWAHDGGRAALLERLRDPSRQLKAEIAAEMEDRGGADRVMIAGTHGCRPEWEGRTVAELAEELKLSPADTVVHALDCCGGRVACIYFSIDEGDMLNIMKDMDIAVGSDGYGLSFDRSITITDPHPRSFGTFPRFLRLVREHQLMPLEDAVYKLTGLPADILGLRDRGTLGGGNAVIAPIMLPIMASLGVTPTVVATLFKVAGEIGLILGPLTGVTLITMEVTGLSYGELMIQAAIPFAVFWLAGAWVGANRAQKRTFGKEGYALGEDVQHLDQVVITPRQKRTTVAFLISFVLLVGYGIATKQGTNYALMVMIVLAAVVAIFGGIEIDRSVDCITKGVASQANMFLIFVSIDVLLNLVTLGGGFDALSNLLGGLAGNSPTAVMLVASVVGGFGIEAAAVAEIQIITDMFGGLATQVGLPMGCFAVSILAATRLTGSAYPTTNFAGQLGTAQCSNTKEALQACWISVAFACVFVVAYSFIGPLILG